MCSKVRLSSQTSKWKHVTRDDKVLREFGTDHRCTRSTSNSSTAWGSLKLPATPTVLN